MSHRCFEALTRQECPFSDLFQDGVPEGSDNTCGCICSFLWHGGKQASSMPNSVFLNDRCFHIVVVVQGPWFAHSRRGGGVVAGAVA